MGSIEHDALTDKGTFMKQYVITMCAILTSSAACALTWEQQSKNFEQILATLVNNEPNVSIARWLHSTEKYLPDIAQFRKINSLTENLYKERLAPMIKRLMNNMSSAIYLQAQAAAKNKTIKLSPELKQACAEFKRLFGTQPGYQEYYDKFLRPLGA